MTNIKYTLDNLRLGMIVNTSQLSNIYNTYILIANQHTDVNGLNTGEIVFIGDKQTKEMKDILDSCTKKFGKRPMIYAQRNIDNGVYSIWIT